MRLTTCAAARSVVALLCLLAAAPAPAVDANVEGTGYTAAAVTGQSEFKWTDLSRYYMLWVTGTEQAPLCKSGTRQSPVNIPLMPPTAGGAFSMYYGYTSPGRDKRWAPMELRDNGHTIELAVENTDYKVVRVLGPNRYVTHHLQQVHFHHPSEHLLNNVRYPMEMHLVHRAEDGSVVVLAVFLQIGSTANAKFSRPFDVMVRPRRIRDRGAIGELPRDDDLKWLLPQNRGYVSYNGSLTTPPCTENVTWIVFTTPMQVTQEQVNRFRSFYSVNARPLQNVERAHAPFTAGTLPDSQ